ncbi:hypothetical protein SXCC_03652 [Gluconacetobacter sp. SXCC-1]|nr:hypothetical protein SXCC_03652 [Gluconacetobacter sp. SXCC-1]
MTGRCIPGFPMIGSVRAINPARTVPCQTARRPVAGVTDAYW